MVGVAVGATVTGDTEGAAVGADVTGERVGKLVGWEVGRGHNLLVSHVHDHLMESGGERTGVSMRK